MIHHLKAEDVTIIDLNYPHGEKIPAIVQMEGIPFLLYGIDSNELELQPNYVLAREHAHCGKAADDWKTEMIAGAVPFPYEKVYALQVRDEGEYDGDTAEYRGLKFVYCGAGRWNIA